MAKYWFNSWNIWQHYKETELILLLNEPKGHSPLEGFIFVSLFPESQRCLSQPWLISVWGDNVLCMWGQAGAPEKGMKPMLVRENVMNFLHSPKPPVWNMQRAVTGADIGRWVLSGDFNSLHHTILVYLDLMDMPFLPLLYQCACCLFYLYYVLVLMDVVRSLYNLQGRFLLQLPVCKLGKWTAKFDFGAVHKNMCLNKCVCFKWV